MGCPCVAHFYYGANILTGTSLIPFAGTLAELPEDPAKREKLKRLQDHHRELNEEMEEIDRLTDIVQKMVVPPNRDKDIELAHIQAELQDVQAELTRLAVAKQRRENPEKFVKPEKQDIPKPNAKIEKLCKKLFKKISTKTHPDRTPNKEYHGLYQLALRYKEIWDLAGLKSIWEEVKDGPTKRHNKTIDELLSEGSDQFRLSIEEEIINLEANIRALAAKREALNNSEFIRVIWAYQQRGELFAIEFYGKVLDASIRHYSNQLVMLRQTLSRMIEEQGEGSMPASHFDIMAKVRREQQRQREEAQRKRDLEEMLKDVDGMDFEE